MKNELYQETLKKFREHFGCEPELVAYAPGRVEVVGNHTDYNEGYVLSAAINYGTFFAIAKNDSTECRLVAGDLMREVRFPVSNPTPSTEDTWSNYCKGVLAGLLPMGEFKVGFKGLFFGDIPQGAGLSSSAALEVTTGLAIAGLYGITASKLDFAKIGLGTACVIKEFVEEEFKCGELLEFVIEEPIPERKIGFAYTSKGLANPALQKFLQDV